MRTLVRPTSDGTHVRSRAGRLHRGRQSPELLSQAPVERRARDLGKRALLGDEPGPETFTGPQRAYGTAVDRHVDRLLLRAVGDRDLVVGRDHERAGGE